MDVAEWLRQLGLERYEAAFRENDVSLAILPSLTAEDLRELGVLSVGHRRLLLEAVATLRPDATSSDDPGQPSQSQLSGPSANSRSSVPIAERRQLSVMFCDLIGSTALSSRLDPEELSALIRGYQARVATTIAGFGGFIARYVGDGILIYFGWPEAYEANAERAVRAALAVINAVAQAPVLTESLEVRIGLATGLVVVGEPIGTGEARQQTAIGETPNLAARLQNLAGPNSLVIDAVTRQQIGGLFDLRDLGTVELKGLPNPVPAWEVLGEAAVESRFEALHAGTMTPLVGREEELDLLQRRWARAKSGEGQVVLLSGEPGIGKSRLTAALDERLRDQPHTRLRYFCSPHHRDSVLYPFIAQLEHAAGLEREDVANIRLEKLEALLAQSGEVRAESVQPLADLLGLAGEGRYPPPPQAPHRRRDMVLAALIGEFEGLAQQQPVLLIFEDAQWADSTSLELLDRAVERAARLPALLIVTFRPEFLPPWTGLAHVALLSLNRLAQREAATLVAGISGGNSLPLVILNRIVERTDGIPLFIEELTKGLIEDGLLREEPDSFTPSDQSSTLTIPSSLQDSLMARLDRLNAAKRVAQLAAIIGREFSYELLQAVAPISEDELRRALRQLVEAGLIFQRGDPPRARYMFKHALIQDAAYQSLLRAQRREQHRRVAETLEQQYPETAETEPEVLALHFGEAGLPDKSIDYYLKAAGRAAERCAMLEMVNQLRRGLQQLQNLPDSPLRRRHELELQTSLGRGLVDTKGSGDEEVGKAFMRARALSLDLNETDQLLSILFGLQVHHFTRSQPDKVLAYAREISDLGHRTGDRQAVMTGDRVAGSAYLLTGRFEEARAAYERLLSLYDEDADDQLAADTMRDPRVAGCAFLAICLTVLGHIDQGAACTLQGLDYAERLQHPISVVFALRRGCIQRMLRGDWAGVTELADRLLAMSSEYGTFLGQPEGLFFKNWAALQEHCEPASLAQLMNALEQLDNSHTWAMLPYFMASGSELLGALGEVDRGAALLERASELVTLTGERWCEAEILRLRADLRVNDVEEQTKMLLRSVELAQVQGARLWNLRSATSLARHWQRQRRISDARNTLAPIVEWFGNDVDAADLRAARTLLNELD